jgi:hypothetical protein
MVEVGPRPPSRHGYVARRLTASIDGAWVDARFDEHRYDLIIHRFGSAVQRRITRMIRAGHVRSVRDEYIEAILSTDHANTQVQWRLPVGVGLVHVGAAAQKALQYICRVTVQRRLVERRTAVLISTGGVSAPADETLDVGPWKAPSGGVKRRRAGVIGVRCACAVGQQDPERFGSTALGRSM